MDRAATTGERQASSLKKAPTFHHGPEAEKLDEAVRLIGRNVTGVRGGAANSERRPAVCSTQVRQEKGKIDNPIRECRHGAKPSNWARLQSYASDATFGLNTRGTLFAVQKALPLFNDGGSIFTDRVSCFSEGFSWLWRVFGSKAALRSFARLWLNELKVGISG